MLLFFSLFFHLLGFQLHTHSTFYSCPTVLGYCVCGFFLFLFLFFCLFSLCFLVSEVSICHIHKIQGFSPAMSSLLMNPLKTFFISVTVFLISSVSFWFCLIISISLLTLPTCSCMLSTLSRASGSDACFVSSNYVFCLLVYLVIFSWQPGMMYWAKGTTVNRTLVMWWQGVEGKAFYSPIIRSQSFSKPVSLDCELHRCFSVSPSP